MRYWRSPTVASPDAYNKDVRVPGHWADKGFGEMTPYKGEAMVGITVYGCSEGKPHCREYLQTQLIEGLIPGQGYEFSMQVSALPRALRASMFGVLFTREPIQVELDQRLDFKPDFVFEEIVEAAGEWAELRFRFTAKEEAAYICIGNFFMDKDTPTQSPTAEKGEFQYAYYYIDELSLRKTNPILKTQKPEDDLSNKSLVRGESFVLKNVYFDTDSDELQPRSFVELDKLLALLRKFPEVNILIVGHTDNEGTAAYNEDLSQRRASTVMRYLTDREISASRLSAEGRGQREPVASNDNPEGRQLNRRVVVEVQ